MGTLIRTDAANADFMALVKYLDADLKIRDGDDHAFYHQFNAITNLKNCVVCYDGNIPVACGAIKPYDGTSMEVKRMYVLPEHRGKGFAVKILVELELWATQLGHSKCILETGIKQPEAIALYKKCGYTVIENYGQYQGVANSVCFEKILGN